MFEIVFDVAKEADKREKAADNLVVLARERAGADLLHTEGVVQKIARLMKVGLCLHTVCPVKIRQLSWP
jgi:hypothetical protein